MAGPLKAMSDTASLADLAWAHETLLRLIWLVQMNAFVNDRRSECLVALSRSAVLLEGLIQEHLGDARRRRDD